MQLKAAWLSARAPGAVKWGTLSSDLFIPCLQLKARCEELKLDWSTLSLENLLKEKQALKNQISEKQKHCLELQVGSKKQM